jgi:4-oxalocrotonate tautomerase family enzyme
MPYINVKTTNEEVTNEHKKSIIKGCTQLMVDVLNKKLDFEMNIFCYKPYKNEIKRGGK